MLGRAHHRRLPRTAFGVPAAASIILGLAACGGDKSTRVAEESGSFKVDVTRADFPTSQHLGADTDLVLGVRNTGDETVPQLTVTIWTGAGGAGAGKANGAFATFERAIWSPVAGFPKVRAAGTAKGKLGAAASAGAEAAQTNSYVFGPLRAGESKTLVWRVVPLKTGTYSVHYAVAAGPDGEAKAQGDGVAGDFRVKIKRTAAGVCAVTKGGGAGYSGACS